MRLMMLSLTLAVLTLPATLHGQTQPETRCLTATELNDVTDHLCARARAKELQYDKLRLVADEYLVRAVAAEAKLDEYKGIDVRRVELERELAVVESERVSRVHVVLYVVGAVIVGGVVGAGVVYVSR